MAKKLSLTQIKQDNKIYSETKRVYLDDNKETYLDIYPNFKPTEVNKVISEFAQLSRVAEKNKIKLTDDLFYPMLSAVAVNHFSNLNIPKKDPVKYIQGLILLIDLKDNGFQRILDSYPAKNWVNLLQKYADFTKTLVTVSSEVKQLKSNGDKEKDNEAVVTITDGEKTQTEAKANASV